MSGDCVSTSDLSTSVSDLQCPNVRGPADEDRETCDSDLSGEQVLRLITGPIGLCERVS